MLHLLIVDDEIECLEMLKELFEERFGEDISVHTACSAKKAIDILAFKKCDVVVIDINMPGMNGIEFYRYVKENYSDMGVLFLTGYSNQEIMYQLIKEKNVRYLMKIEMPQVITDTVNDMWNDILKERIQNDKIRMYESKQFLADDMDYYKQKELIEDIIFTESKTKIKEYEKYFGDSLDYKRTMFTFIGRMSFGCENLLVEQRKEIISLIENRLPVTLNGKFYVLESHYILGLVQPKLEYSSNKRDNKRILQACISMLEMVCQSFGLDNGRQVSFVIGDQACYLEDLKKNYFILKDKIMTAHSEMSVSVASSDEIDAQNNRIGGEERYLKILFIKNYLEQSEYQPCKSLLKELGSELELIKSMHDPSALEIYYNISMLYLRHINVNGWNDKIPYHIGTYQLSRIDCFNSWKEVVVYLLQLSDVFQKLKTEKEETMKNEVIAKIGRYIQTHLGDDLSLGYLAEMNGFNASYLSRAFKQEYKCTLSEYILKERIKWAKKMLMETEEKIYVIAENVGYHTVTSFNKVFMKSEGLSPTEYRNQFKK